MFRNWQYRLLALVLALACWYIVTGREKVQTWVDMPVEIIGAKQDMLILDGMKTKIAVRVRGPRALVRGLEEKRPAYSLDLSNLKSGETVIPFEAENIPLSMALEVVEVDPPSMTLTADHLVTRSVSVLPVWTAEPGPDLNFVNATAEPGAVSLAGPQALISTMETIPTRSVAMTVPGAGRFGAKAELDLPRSVSADPASVRITLDYAVKLKSIWLKLPVKVLPENGEKVSVTPTTVQIRCGVPLPLLRDKDFKSQFLTYVLLPSGLAPGKHSLPVRFKLPEGCVLEKTVPEKLEVTIKKN